MGCTAADPTDVPGYGGKNDDPTTTIEEGRKDISDAMAVSACVTVADRYMYAKSHEWPQAMFASFTACAQGDPRQAHDFASIRREVSGQYRDPVSGELLVWAHTVEVKERATGDTWQVRFTWVSDPNQSFHYSGKNIGYFGRTTDNDFMKAVSEELLGVEAGAENEFDNLDEVLKFEDTDLDAVDRTAGTNGLAGLPSAIATTVAPTLTPWKDSGASTAYVPEVARVLEVLDGSGGSLGYMVGVRDPASYDAYFEIVLFINKYGWTVDMWNGACRYPDEWDNC